MVTRCVNNIVDALDSDSLDKSTEGDGSHDDSDSDISDVRIIVGSENRQLVESEVYESSSSISSNYTHAGTVARSLIECLQMSKCSELSRKRRVHCNPPVGKRKCKGAKPSKGAVSVSPQQRIKEFAGENFTISNGKLFCLIVLLERAQCKEK